jgi:3-deoxy-7-phosphoheptulonate synthase
LKRYPLPYAGQTFVNTAREHVNKIVKGEDDRLAGWLLAPCSIHDTRAALEYAEKLQKLRVQHAADLEVVMRVYFEKPRTRSGWKGLHQRPAYRRFV